MKASTQFSIDSRPWHWYAAGKIIAAHAVITILGALWALLIGEVWMILVFMGLWLLASALYSEWRNGA